MIRKVLSAVLLAVLAQACNCDDPFLDRTPEAELEVVDEQGGVAGTPPLILEFGDVEIGQRGARRVILKNLGNANLAIERVGPVVDPADPICPTSSAEFAYPPVSPSQKVELAGGGEKTIEVAYRPQDGGNDCAIMEVKSNDSDEPSTRVYFVARGSAAKFCATQSTLDFGDVILGQRGTLSTEIGNCGIRPLTLTAVQVTTSFPPFELTTQFTTPHTFLPGEMMPVVLAFAPTQARRYGGIGAQADPGVILFTTDVSVGSLTLLGRGITPPACRLSVAPTAINFGTVAPGASADREVLLANAGDAACTVQSVERVGGSAEFTLVGTAAPPAFQVGPAQTQLLTIHFAPAAAGQQNAVFRVTSDNPGQLTTDITVEANQPPPPGCHLEADPAFLNFGVVPTGSTTTRQIALHSVGDEDCSLREVRFVLGAPDFSSSAVLTPLIGALIPAGDTYNLNIDFRTTSPGPHSGRAQLVYKEFGIGTPNQTLDVDLAANAQAPAICLTPDPVDFGSVPVGGEARLNLSIQSCGAAPLNVRGIHFGSGSSSAFDTPAAPGLPVVLLPGTSVNLEIRYRPAQAAGDLAVLVVNSDDPGVPSANVRVLGNASGLCPPLMQCTPETLEFGEVEAGVQQTRTVVCRNYGTQSVTVSNATVSPATFSVSGSLPSSIAAGDAMTLQVSMTGQATGAVTGTLTVTSNACESMQQVQLTATVIPAVTPECLLPSSFQPREEWSWTTSSNHPNKDQVWVTPLVINLTDDNNDGVISDQDIPDIVFSTFDGRDFTTNPADPNLGAPIRAVVRALSGDDGHELWTVMPDALMVQSEAGLAAADIDGDGKPEIIASKFVLLEGESIIPEGPKLMGRFVRGKLICFGNDGSFKWESDDWTGAKEEGEDGGAPAIADLDQDGFAEVIYRNHVFDHEGHLKWAGTKKSGSAGHGGLPVPVDLDGDGRLEVSAGLTAYRSDGTVLWDREDKGFDGLPAIADFEGDGTPEVVVHNGKLIILNGEDGTDAYPDIELPFPMMGCTDQNMDDCSTPIPTAVALADFDGDNLPEIAVSNRSFLLLYEADGTEKWRVPISDFTGASGPSAFDFEGDGIAEVVYADEQSAFALRGNNGMNIYTSPRSSRTIFEYPAIADTDRDGHANMVVVMNEPLLRSAKGIKVLTNSAGNWVNARPIWNQHAYHVSNVTSNGTVPRVETPHYRGNRSENGFRTQTQRCQ